MISWPSSWLAPLSSVLLAQSGAGQALMGSWHWGWKRRKGGVAEWAGKGTFVLWRHLGFLLCCQNWEFNLQAESWLFASSWSGTCFSIKGIIKEVKHWRSRCAERSGMYCFYHLSNGFPVETVPLENFWPAVERLDGWVDTEGGAAREAQFQTHRKHC